MRKSHIKKIIQTGIKSHLLKIIPRNRILRCLDGISQADRTRIYIRRIYRTIFNRFILNRTIRRVIPFKQRCVHKNRFNRRTRLPETLICTIQSISLIILLCSSTDNRRHISRTIIDTGCTSLEFIDSIIAFFLAVAQILIQRWLKQILDSHIYRCINPISAGK